MGLGCARLGEGEEHAFEDVNHGRVQRTSLRLQDEFEYFKRAHANDLPSVRQREETEPKQLRKYAKQGRKAVIVDEHLRGKPHRARQLAFGVRDQAL